jgi:hypothetical protein
MSMKILGLVNVIGKVRRCDADLSIATLLPLESFITTIAVWLYLSSTNHKTNKSYTYTHTHTYIYTYIHTMDP